MHKIYKLNCKICGKQFTSPTKEKCCSVECNDQQIDLENKIKEKEYLVNLDNKYLERKIRWGEKKCKICDKLFMPKMSKQIYCSKDCQHIKAKNNYNPEERSLFIILQRDKFKCAYCGKTSYEDGVKLHVDHVIPVALSGSNLAENLVTSCELCNLQKGTRVIDSDDLLREIKKRNNISNISNKLRIDNTGQKHRIARLKNIKNSAV